MSGYLILIFSSTTPVWLSDFLILMARDRLAVVRAQQYANHRDHWPSSYPSQAPAGRSEPRHPPRTYVRPERRRTGSYADPGIQYAPNEIPGVHWAYPSPAGTGRPDKNCIPNKYPYHNDQFSMSRVRGSAPNISYPHGDMSTFYSEISFIQDNLRTFNDNVSRISDLHSRSLNSTDWASSRRIAHQLDGLTKETSTLSGLLKVRIKNLHAVDVGGRDGEIRKQQTGLVKHKFMEAIQNYQQVEQAYRSKFKQRMERHYKVVNPDATSDEVRAFIKDDECGQIFTQIANIQSSNRYGTSRIALREAQERHNDVKNIERTLEELAQLFNDMHILVMRDGEVIDGIQAMAMNVEKHTEIGLHHTERAIASARGARTRRKWICAAIVLIIIVCLAIAIGVLASQLNTNNN
ncbi:t-SNARE [Gautieria morchelliformis]|nr:t-SNARE [Gautieria morchelliformis]